MDVDSPEGRERHDLQAHAAGVRAYLDLMDRDEEDCTCEDCVVRTVLEAAYPHLRTLVLVEERRRPADLLAIDLSKVKPEHFTPHRQIGST